ncbi:transcriptional adapter 2A [Arctopsyche grandis]|uniref:transcriptional adapter 2A n=1 Tax=Arctopsyche grandis TaxID=121162 RepID=UPI00406D6D75
MDGDNLQPACSSCYIQLVEPYVECEECEDISLCTNCFSTGVQPAKHRNDHSYSIRRNDINIFENSDWSAKDEYLLLQAVSKFGYGNWDCISKVMQKYTQLQCKEHYDHFYIDRRQLSELPKLTTWSTVRSDPPFLYKLNATDEPPRSVKSNICQNIAGYNAYRSEFEFNYDNNAEHMLNFEDFEDDEDKELTEGLQCAVVNAYNNRLKERSRRYDIMRRHGLIAFRKFSYWMQSYENTLGKPVCDRLCIFMQLLSGVQFDTLMESLSKESELQINLYRLYDLRRNGITSTVGRQVYEMLKKKREEHLRETKMYAIKYGDWKQMSEDKPNIVNVTESDVQSRGIRKRLITPLEIVGLPDYEKLTDKEREFCSRIRLPPSNFLEYREILANESEKRGSLRLCDARKLMKIDVNKTRKLYDLLITEGIVKKPA